MRALITGGAGFIGYHLACRLVDDGWHVDLVDSFARGAFDRPLSELAASPRVRLLERDLTAVDAFAGAEEEYTHIFHLAAIVGVSHVLQRPYGVLRDNAAMLAAAIELARAQPRLERLVFASTSEVYAGTYERDGGPIPTPENVELVLPDLARPRTCYLLSKIYGEATCRHADVPFTIVRPHNVYGPRMGLAHAIPELLERAHAAPQGGALEVYSIGHRRTFCHVTDAVEMLVRAATTSVCAGEVLNIGAEEPEITIGELAELVIAVAGKDLRIVAGADTPGSPSRRRPDMTKTATLLGYRARVDLEPGIRDTYDWYRTHVFDSPVVGVR